MKKNYYSLFDKLAGEFMPMFVAANDKVALRMVEDSLKQNSVHCEDLEVFYICSFSTDYSNVEFKAPVKIAAILLDDKNVPFFEVCNEVIK